jgi:hypothetical protein
MLTLVGWSPVLLCGSAAIVFAGMNDGLADNQLPEQLYG